MSTHQSMCVHRSSCQAGSNGALQIHMTLLPEAKALTSQFPWANYEMGGHMMLGPVLAKLDLLGSTIEFGYWAIPRVEGRPYDAASGPERPGYIHGQMFMLKSLPSEEQLWKLKSPWI